MVVRRHYLGSLANVDQGRTDVGKVGLGDNLDVRQTGVGHQAGPGIQTYQSCPFLLSVVNTERVDGQNAQNFYHFLVGKILLEIPSDSDQI